MKTTTTSASALATAPVGPSLVEDAYGALATAIVAAIRRHSDVVLGNVIGSNIFNVLAILGVTVVIHPMPCFAPKADISASRL